MEKVIIMGFLSLYLFAQDIQTHTVDLQHKCLSCHQEQQIPNNLIYKRYLMKYSTNGRMEEAMFNYLKDPKKEHSIMPAPFFLKFPMKAKIDLDAVILRQAVQAYLEKYDMKKKLILGRSSSL